MNQVCVNGGGLASQILLTSVPALNVAIELDNDDCAPLSCREVSVGQTLTVRDLEGVYYRARITRHDDTGATLIPLEIMSRQIESPLDLEVCLALTEDSQFEQIARKLTELGVNSIVPFTSSLSASPADQDAQRWSQSIRQAANACQRAVIPQLTNVLNWDEMLWHAKDVELKLFLSEDDAAWTLPEAFKGETPGKVVLVVGPDEGFTPEEVDAARNLGFIPVNIGPRVLTAETAAVVGAALTQFACGDLG